MPPLTDLENSGDPAGDTKTCNYADQTNKQSHKPDPAPHPDLPPESFWVSASDELDWLDRNTFIQRNCSVKFAITQNLKSSDPNFKPSHRSFSFSNNKPKSSIIGPPKSQKFTHAVGNPKTRQIENRKLFRSRSESGKDRAHQLHEPVSPTVSCMGTVGSNSKRCRKRTVGFWATVRATFMSRTRQDRCRIN